MMNRKARRTQQALQHAHVSSLPEALTPVPREEWPLLFPMPTGIWRSRRYMAQLYDESGAFKVLKRLSICRVRLSKNGRWEDGLTWDELQAIKRELGFGDWYGIEVYPRDQDVINVANFRHLWLLPEPLPVGWVK